MRYDTKVIFARNGPAIYDEETGDYSDPVAIKTTRYASVMDTNRETMHLVYGEIKQGSLTIQLQNHYDDPFDYITIGDTKYKVDYTRKLRVKQTFVVSEEQ